MAKQTPGSRCDTGSKYELSVTALFASLLSKNKNVEDYCIFSNVSEAQPFDDIVAEVYFKGIEERQIYAIQVKSGKDKLNISKYCDGYDKIIGKGGLKPGESARNDRIHFWYYCNKSPSKNTFPMTGNGGTFDLKLRQRCRPYNMHETILDRAVSYELFSGDIEILDHQNFFNSFYLFFNQPDTETIIRVIKGIWNIDNPSLILLHLDNYFTKNTKGLDKTAFEHELLKINLSNYVVTPTTGIAFKHEGIAALNRLMMKQDVTIVQNQLHVEQYLFGCILWNIRDIISVDKWNDMISKGGKLDRELKESLKTKQFKPETLKDVILHAWVNGKAPLLLRVDTPLPLLKEFSHLQKSYIVIDSDVDKRYEEMKSYGLNALRHVGDAESDEITKVILVSLQGRKPVSLLEIINQDTMLMESVTCLDIINLMRPRNVYLKQDRLDDNSYMLFIIETTNLEQHNYDEHRPTGNNITIYCDLDRSCECYKKIREDLRFRSYQIFRLRLTDDNKLILLSESQDLGAVQREEENRDLKCSFCDQNGESVYNAEPGDPIPIIGEVLFRIYPKYVPRYLRKHIKGEDKTIMEYSGKRIAENDFFEESSGPITVVAGEPGIGKTALLHSLFHLCESQYYVLFIDLARCQVDLHERNPKLFQNPLHFLCEKHDSLPYNRLLASFCANHARLILILDSFDEVTATCEQQVLELIEAVQKIGLQRIIIASRLTVVSLLINKFHVEPFKIESLNAQSAEQYVDNWNLSTSSLQHVPSEFLTNPLYLNMLRTISENEINLEVVNKWNLFESIVDLKMKDYCQRMKPHCLDEKEKQNILSHHWSLALQVVFGSYTVVQKLQEKNHPKYSNFTRLGFINCYDGNENPIFVHYTFAEFFVMQWLIGNIHHEDAAYVYSLMLESKRNILDMHSEKFPFHKTVLYGSVEAVEKLCRENSRLLLETDDLGRNVLHLAAIIYDRDFSQKSNRLNLLLRHTRMKGYNLYARDKILKWTWIDYWENYIFIRNLWKDEYIVILEVYLKYYATHMDDINYSTCKFLFSEDFNRLYNAAIKHSSIEMIQDLLFLKYKEDKTFLEFRNICLQSKAITKKKLLNLRLRKENLTGIHLACIYSNIETVKAYIATKTNFNKTDIFNCTPLHYSVFAKQNTALVKLLWDSYKDLNPYAGRRNNTTVVHMSVRTGDVDITRTLLEKVDANLMDAENLTPLLVAIDTASADFDETYDTSKLEMIKALLEHTPGVTCVPSTKYTPLDLATMCGRRDIIEMLLKHNACVNLNKMYSNRPLYNAINTENKESIELLLRNGVSVNYMDADGLTPLIYAIKVRNKEIIQMLLNYNAEVNFENKFGQTPLYWAIETGNIEIIEMLLRIGANVNCIDPNGLTPLIWAITRKTAGAVQKVPEYGLYANFKVEDKMKHFGEALEITKLLLRNSANANHVDPNGLTPLTHAINAEDTNIIQLLLNYNADVNFRNNCNQVPLHNAIKTENMQIVELLLGNGANVNTSNAPLIYAIKVGNTNIVETLLNYKADANVKDTHHQTCLDLAIEEDNVEIIKLLLQNGADVNSFDSNNVSPLILAIQKEKKDIVSILLNYDADLNNRNSYGQTPLQDAMALQNIEIIELLLQSGADVNCTDLKDLTPLTFAIMTENRNILSMLLNYNVDVNAKNKYGQSPLYGAIIGKLQRREEVIEMLLEKNAHVNCIDKFGFTPLITVAETGNADVAKILLNNHANVNFKNEYGVTALFIAALRKDVAMVKLLLKHGADASTITFTDGIFHKAKNAKNMGIVVRLLKIRSASDLQETFAWTYDFSEPDESMDVIKMVTENWNDIHLEDELHVLVEEGLLNSATVKPLMEWGDDLDLSDKFWITTLRLIEETNDKEVDDAFTHHIFDCALEHRVPELCRAISKERNVDIIKIFLRNGLSPNSINHETGLTLLQTAVGLNDIEYVQILLQNRVDVNFGVDNFNILHRAVYHQNIDIIEMLLEHNFDVNRDDLNVLTPLQVAIELKDTEITQVLLRYGADANSAKNATPPLHIAIERNNEEIIRMLLQFGADVNLGNKFNTPLCTAISERNANIVELLLQHNCEVNHVDRYGLTPLMKAAAIGDTAIAEMLLINGADVNFEERSGLTALYLAARTGNRCTVDILLKYGANRNIKTAEKELLKKVEKLQKAFVLNIPANNGYHKTCAIFLNKMPYISVFSKSETLIRRVLRDALRKN